MSADLLVPIRLSLPDATYRAYRARADRIGVDVGQLLAAEAVRKAQSLNTTGRRPYGRVTPAMHAMIREHYIAGRSRGWIADLLGVALETVRYHTRDIKPTDRERARA